MSLLPLALSGAINLNALFEVLELKNVLNIISSLVHSIISLNFMRIASRHDFELMPCARHPQQRCFV